MLKRASRSAERVFLAVCCSALQSVAVCCSVLQCVAVCCIVETSVKECREREGESQERGIERDGEVS